jgi:mono/diheme cytochrome c family protein
MKTNARIFSNLCLSLLAAAVVAGCGPKGNEANVELIQDMMESPSLKVQDHFVSDREKSSMMVPPEGTVPRNYTPYKYPTDPLAAEANLKNPLAGDQSLATLERGRKYFETNCMVCHGVAGHGDGPVSSKMALKPPPLVSDKVKNFKDGRIFHIITMGQGVMGSYANQITNPEDRWSVVNYVRSLQRADVAKAGGSK